MAMCKMKIVFSQQIYLQLLIRLFLQIHFDETTAFSLFRLLFNCYFVIFLADNKLTFFIACAFLNINCYVTNKYYTVHRQMVCEKNN